MERLCLSKCCDTSFIIPLSNPLQKYPKAQHYENGWELYEDVEQLMQRQVKGKYSYQGNDLGVQRTTTPTPTISGYAGAGTNAPDDELTTTTTAMSNEEHTIEPYDTSIPPSSPPPSPSIAPKRRFSLLDSESVGDVNDTAIKSLSRFSSSGKSSSRDSLSARSTSSSSKRGRMSGAIALANIGHGIIDLGASYRKSIEDKEARHHDKMVQHQDAMSQMSRQAEREERRDVTFKEATDRAQELERDLSDDDLAALIDVFQTEEGSAMAYLAIKIESVRKAWVKRKISFATQVPPPL